MTPDDRQRLEAVAAYCERMGVDDLRVVPVEGPWALAAAIRAALAAASQPIPCEHCGYMGVLAPDGVHREGADRWYREGVALAEAETVERPRFDGTPRGHWQSRGFQWASANLDRQRLKQRIADLEREHVSREDREAALALAHECGYHYGREQFGNHDEAMAEARRLLKLEGA